MRSLCLLVLTGSLSWLSSAFLLKSPSTYGRGRPLSLQPAAADDDAMLCEPPRPDSLIHSESFGTLHRIRLPGEDQDTSFVGAMAVPSFAATNGTIRCLDEVGPVRGLEGVVGRGPAFVLDHVFSETLCQDMIETCERVGFGSFQSGKNHHGALQIVVSEPMAETVAQVLGRHVNLGQVEERRREMEESVVEEEEDVRLVYAGLNRRWRIYRYAPGGEETFAPHIDAGFPPSGLSDDESELVWDTSNGEIVSRLTVLFYLNEDFFGGETKFYAPVAETTTQGRTSSMIAAVRPKTGSCLVFPQGVGEAAVDHARTFWPLHEGAPVDAGGSPKYVIRSDLLFIVQRETIPLDDPLFRHDHRVRQTFLPQQSPVFDPKFLSHLSSLYNPHMGVENMGLFLYSFLRLTKKRTIVEIGAGYTSVWILQALQDNDKEMERLRSLQRNGECRLLDWPWTVPEGVEDYDSSRAWLLSIDNCEHQKETATGASAIAKSLGLGDYMRFLRGDSFELELDPVSIDVLWCDFGVGSRMKDFVMAAWPSLRPGGYLLCHSTLTNQRTREWLESVRGRQGEDITGIPQGEYVELSLLEPHKHYQNSISIFQKRKGYTEPIYSEYA
jgi:predicted O-methyltransferase YrrM